jgi:hypothetical protein
MQDFFEKNLLIYLKVLKLKDKAAREGRKNPLPRRQNATLRRSPHRSLLADLLR